jgi:flagellar assembly protein FliH
MDSPRKYLFDTSFDEAAPPSPVVGRAPTEVNPTRAQLEAARAEGLAQGRTAALVDMARGIETRAADTLASLDRGMAALIAARAAIVRDTESQAIALLRAVLQKIVPALCRRDPLAELEALVARCLDETLDEPRIVLRVSDAMFDTMQSRLDAMTMANGYSGKLILIADAALAEGDGRVEWADGGAERDTRRLMAEIDAILLRSLADPPPAPAIPEESNDE